VLPQVYKHKGASIRRATLTLLTVRKRELKCVDGVSCARGERV